MRVAFRFADPTGLLMGAIGLTTLGVQPQLLHAAIAMGIPAGQAGVLSTVEIAAMALAAYGGFSLVSGRRRGVVLAGAAVAMIAGYLLAFWMGRSPLCFVARAMAGCGEGLLAAAGTLAVTGSAAPVRSGALFIGLTAAMQIAVTMLLPAMPALASHPESAILLLLALAGGVSLPLAGGLSGAPGSAARPRLPTSRATAAVGLIGLLNLIGSTCWTYLDVWGDTVFPGSAPHMLVPLCLASQIGANLLLAWRGPTHGAHRMLVVAMLGEAASLWWIGHPATGGDLLLAAMLFGFSWQATLPLATALYLKADPEFGAVCLILPASLIGIAAGPALAAFVPIARLDMLFALGGLMLAGTALASRLTRLRHRAGLRRAYS